MKKQGLTVVNNLVIYWNDKFCMLSEGATVFEIMKYLLLLIYNCQMLKKFMLVRMIWNHMKCVFTHN